jgi:hypothetical protein
MRVGSLLLLIMQQTRQQNYHQGISFSRASVYDRLIFRAVVRETTRAGTLELRYRSQAQDCCVPLFA